MDRDIENCCLRGSRKAPLLPLEKPDKLCPRVVLWALRGYHWLGSTRPRPGTILLCVTCGVERPSLYRERCQARPIECSVKNDSYPDFTACERRVARSQKKKKKKRCARRDSVPGGGQGGVNPIGQFLKVPPVETSIWKPRVEGDTKKGNRGFNRATFLIWKKASERSKIMSGIVKCRSHSGREKKSIQMLIRPHSRASCFYLARSPEPPSVVSLSSRNRWRIFAFVVLVTTVKIQRSTTCNRAKPNYPIPVLKRARARGFLSRQQSLSLSLHTTRRSGLFRRSCAFLVLIGNLFPGPHPAFGIAFL